MRVRVPFGQYVALDSPVHRLEPRAKMALTVAYTILLFASDGYAGLVVAALVASAGVLLSRVPIALVARGIKAISFLLAFTLMAHALRWSAATEMLVRVGPIGVDAQGLATGAYFAGRIVLLVMGTSLITLTTSPVQLTDALERVLRPLNRLRVPVAELAMMLTVALRFIPTTAEEAEKIVVAQAARGARFDSGGIVARARAYLPVLVPLFVNLFRRADELAVAMEARAYHGGPGRTRLHESVLTAADWGTMLIGGGAMIALSFLL